MAAPESTGNHAIHVKEEREGERHYTDDFFFDKIGDALPIKPSDHQFDKATLPAQPLAVSERFRLVFVAHSDGFFVARTKDVIESAKVIKDKGSGASVQEICVVDVTIGRVHILALSADSSTLAACVEGDIFFFSVDSLLDKDKSPSFSCRLTDSNSVKAMQWNTKLESSYIVLSNLGELYHGSIKGSLVNVMDNVDAAEWSLRGNFVAVARKNVLIILSSKFTEHLSISLSFDSWIGDSNLNYTVKVDSIRWIRHDCIVLGCIQLSGDGEEKDYLVQVITNENGNIIDDNSETVALCFSDLFSGLVDDIVPFGSGPYLFLSYLDQCQLAITANRKNADEHILLIGWSLLDDCKEAVIIDIGRDNLLPRIELQENGDDNLVLGLCTDRISLYDKVRVQLGVEEQKELSPYCVLLCLTLEGKLLLFHVSSVKGTPDVCQDSCVLPKTEENDAPAVAPLHEVGVIDGLTEKFLEADLKPLAVSQPFSGQKSHEESVTGQNEVNALVGSTALETAGKLSSWLSGRGSRVSEDSSLQNSVVDRSSSSTLVGGFMKTGTQNVLAVESSSSLLKGILQTDASLSTGKQAQKCVEAGTEVPGKTTWTLSQSAISQSASSDNRSLTKDSDIRCSISPSHYSQGYRLEDSNVCAKTAQAFVNLVNHTFNAIGTASQSMLVNSTDKLPSTVWQSTSMGPGKIQSLPSICSSRLSLHESAALGSPGNFKFCPVNGSSRTSDQLGSEPNSSKQFGNIKDMIKEMDTLLACIEKPGGFADACAGLQKGPVAALEHGIASLSEKCRMWMDIMEERLGEFQLLLDKTAQVMARKVYMQGIVTQATDDQYWDLLNRQKLSYELEVKRQHILDVNQDLTNQLIELERHFNALEIHKFGDNVGTNLGRRTFHSKFGYPRHILSFHSLHNTMNSQLQAAEQLSECLSKQMALLSVESSGKQLKVKKELFETIGIPYDGACFSSPEITKSGDATAFKRSLHSPSSTVSKDQSRRIPSSSMRITEPETARRRRDSLDRSWSTFEPPKTTVKRMLLHREEATRSKSSLLADKQVLSPHMLGGSAGSHFNSQTTPLTSLCTSRNMGIQDTSSVQLSKKSALFRWADLPGASQSVGCSFPGISPGDNFSANKLFSGSQASYSINQSIFGGANAADAVKSGNGFHDLKLVSTSGTKFNSLGDGQPHQTPLHFTSSSSQTFPLLHASAVPDNSSEMAIKKGTQQLALGSSKHWSATPGYSSVEHKNADGTPSVLPSSKPAMHAISGRLSEFDSLMNKSQSAGKISSVSSISRPVPSLSLSAPPSSSTVLPVASKFSSETLTAQTISSSKGNLGADDVSFSISSSPAIAPSPSRAFSAVLSSTSFSLKVPEATTTPSVSSTIASSISGSSKAQLEHTNEPVSLKPDLSSAQAPIQKPRVPTDDIGSKPELSVASQPAFNAPTESFVGNKPCSNDIASSSYNPAYNVQPQQPSSPQLPFSTSQSLGGANSGKDDLLDVAISQEDEMEEEAPETNGLSLGSLGGFGIGSVPSATIAKPNPFGTSFASASPSSSPFSMSVPSGELFRPASFSLQYPQTQSSQLPNLATPSSGFGTGTTIQAPTGSAFGQPAQIGSGQKALGSVLGAFGQARQIGGAGAAAGFATAGGFGGGFASTTAGFANAAKGSGFANAVTGSGFANAVTGSGFANAATSGGFAGLSSGTGGFGGLATAASGFAGAASAGTGFGAVSVGGGFGAFSNQGVGGFSSFGSGSEAAKPPSELIMQMRK